MGAVAKGCDIADEGRINADFDEHSTYDLGLSLSGPLIKDQLAGRLTLSSYSTDGWYDNPNTGDELGSGDSDGASVALEWTPTDTFTAYIRAEHSEDEFAPRAEAFVRSMSPGFDPAINYLGTGTVTDNATQLPYAFDGTQCNGIDRLQRLFHLPGWGRRRHAHSVTLHPDPVPPGDSE